MQEIKDEKLMIEVKDGNLDSLVPLFDKYQTRIYNFFLRVTHDKPTSEDLTQTVFSRVIKYRQSFNEVYLFRSWLFQIARNVHIDHYSKQPMIFSDYDTPDEIVEDAKNAIETMEQQQRE
ncbi:MAG: sigma-70 family RNA polymerase sigma factor, partial [Bacteroidales bacterium]|nr:sigma-70 family RNA polymerase sigma factor [Bacteroidales bacterium]